MPDFTIYGNARNALLQAHQVLADALPEDVEPAQAALEVASQQLVEAEEPIRPTLDTAWDNNRAAVAAAQQALVDARQNLTAVEIEVSEAARARNPPYPLLNAEEHARVQEAEAARELARQNLAEARQMFKAGVTVEQLEAMT